MFSAAACCIHTIEEYQCAGFFSQSISNRCGSFPFTPAPVSRGPCVLDSWVARARQHERWGYVHFNFFLYSYVILCGHVFFFLILLKTILFIPWLTWGVWMWRSDSGWLRASAIFPTPLCWRWTLGFERIEKFEYPCEFSVTHFLYWIIISFSMHTYAFILFLISGFDNWWSNGSCW